MEVKWEKADWPGMWLAYLPGYLLEIVTVIDDEDESYGDMKGDGCFYHCRIWRTEGGDPRHEVVREFIYFNINYESLASAKAELENKLSEIG